MLTISVLTLYCNKGEVFEFWGDLNLQLLVLLSNALTTGLDPYPVNNVMCCSRVLLAPQALQAPRAPFCPPCLDPQGPLEKMGGLVNLVSL